jgi:ribosomal-protein-alanine N-acetyltransferase
MNALLSPSPTRRPMTVSDLDAVCAIEASAYGFPWSRGNFIDSLAAGYLAEVLEAETIIGYFVALPGVDELHLLNITIAPRWQGQGLGSALLDAVQAHARARAFATLWLEVRASNHRARALYARRGFAEVGLRRAYYPAVGGREDAILMSLDLRHGVRDALV